LSQLLREREAEEEKVATELQEELARSVRPAEKAWKALPTLADLVKKGGDESRLKLRPVLRRVIEGAWVLVVRRGIYMLAAVQVHFTGGGQRNWLILNKTAANNRAADWAARDFADVGLPDDLDLRKRSDVKALERELLAVDLS
jgi:hypothetical protein